MQQMLRNSRGDKIRTCGLCVPNAALYQTEPRLDMLLLENPRYNLGFLFMRAIDGARTRGLDLGKVARYQLRHYRMFSYPENHTQNFFSLNPDFLHLYLLDLLVKPSTD